MPPWYQNLFINSVSRFSLNWERALICDTMLFSAQMQINYKVGRKGRWPIQASLRIIFWISVRQHRSETRWADVFFSWLFQGKSNGTYANLSDAAVPTSYFFTSRSCIKGGPHPCACWRLYSTILCLLLKAGEKSRINFHTSAMRIIS